MKLSHILAATGLIVAAVATSSPAAADPGRDGWRHDHGRDWHHHRHCHTEWRHHHRVQVCN